MKRFCVALGFLLCFGSLRAGVKNVPAAFTGVGVVNGTSTFVAYSSVTIVNNATEEPGGLRLDGYYNGTGIGTLPATLWANMFYNQSGHVDTAHGGALFGRVIGGANAEGFIFGVEGNAWGVSTSTDADVVGIIGHSVWKHDTSTPTANIIGVEARSEVTNANLTVNRDTGTVIGVRSEVYGGYDKYSFYGVNADAKLVNTGDIIKVRKPTVALDGGGTVPTAGACGGILVVTSTGIITTGAAAFSAPSSTVGPSWNDGCEITVVNGNLTGGRTITFQFSGTNLYTISGAPIVVGALGGTFRIASYPAAGVWFQTTAVTK